MVRYVRGISMHEVRTPLAIDITLGRQEELQRNGEGLEACPADPSIVGRTSEGRQQPAVVLHTIWSLYATQALVAREVCKDTARLSIRCTGS